MEDDEKKKTLASHLCYFCKCNNFTIIDKYLELAHTTSNLLGAEE